LQVVVAVIVAMARQLLQEDQVLAIVFQVQV